MQVDLQIDSVTTANKKQSKNIGYVNPNATNAQLKTLAQTLNALTTNIYTNAIRVSEDSVDSSDTKPSPTLTVDSSGNITYNGGGELSVAPNDSTDNNKLFLNIYNNKIRCINSGNPQQFATSFKGKLYATESETYTAASIAFTVTGG